MTDMDAPAIDIKEQYIPGFDAAAFERVQKASAGLLSLKREQAFRAYAELSSPTARDEEWRRTDPALFPFSSFRPLAPFAAARAVQPDPWDDHFDVVVSVTDNTYAIHDRSGVTGRGLCKVLSLEEATGKMHGVLDTYLQGTALPKAPRKFERLNAAFWNVGLAIHVPAKSVVPKGILIRYDHASANAAVLPRLLVVAEDQSEVTIVEHFTSPDGVPLLCVSGREFYAGQGANLKLVSVQEWGNATYHIGEDWARAGRDGRIEWVTLTLGGKISKMMVGSDVCEPNAQAWLSGVFFAEGDQHFDQRTLQLHSSPDTYSNLLYKGAVKDRGHSVYQGIINAKPGAIRVDAYQINNNLILSEGARADSLPGLEIDADDLKCSHGSTMGTLDPEQIYYLRSRGLPEIEARRLIVAGFFEEVIAKVPFEFIQDRLREDIERKMGGA